MTNPTNRQPLDLDTETLEAGFARRVLEHIDAWFDHRCPAREHGDLLTTAPDPASTNPRPRIRW
ncbi:hypothetical protein ABZ540_35420 [Nocardia xishanensis]|uniref:hypothetical protein n=1 Tax=Nocardia xishanensis TaxID=238964 RepID=UPI00340D8E2A